ncbi:MAG: hypothetical protein KA158_07835 [Leucobacter sp.]|nr:hypothetical protein [Leucobacter sp.]
MKASSSVRQRAGRIAVIALSCVGLMGCTASPTPAEVTTPPATSTPDPAPSTAPAEPEEGVGADFDVVIPECPSLITDEEAQRIFLPNFEEGVGPSAAFQEEFRRARLGPAAGAALDEAVEFRSCVWGVQLSDLVEHLFVAELPSNVLRDLVVDLRSSSYVESQSGAVTLFSHAFGEPEAYNWYGFSGNVWVASFGQRGAAPIEAAFANLRAANPEWQPTAP